MKACCRALFSLLISCLAGCGLTANQKAAIANFGTATSATSDLVADQFNAMREDTIYVRTTLYSLGWGGVKLDDKALDFDAGMDLDDLQARLQAALALKNYG